jgi:hypothetical protein
MMLDIDLSYIAFIMLRYLPFIPSLFRTLIMKECWILSKAFSASIEMMIWFLSLILFMCCITFIYLCMLSSLYLWNETYLIVVYDLFNVLLDSVCKYFIEDFCIYVHQGYGL